MGLTSLARTVVSRRGRGIAAAVTIATLALAALALAATGDLTPIGCIDDEDSGADTCAATGDGLDTAEAIAVSPDGTSVYTVSSGDDAIARFRRNSATGALTYKGCTKDNFSTATCGGQIPGNVLLDGADIAVSPDGADVYVTSRFGDSGIYHFRRNQTSGFLAYKNCVGDDDAPGACSKNMAGIGDPVGIAISDDGNDVYLADFDVGAVAHLHRNSTTGNLSPRGCVVETGPSPDDPCAQNYLGLAGADALDVSADGTSLYAVGAFSDAIVRFVRNPTTGAIRPRACIRDENESSEPCTHTVVGLVRPEGVVVSPDGASVYATARDSSSLVWFKRTSTGALQAQACYVDNEFPTVPCEDSPKGLTGAHDLAMSPDGNSVYVAATYDAAVTEFGRDRVTGALTFRHCIKDDDASASYQSCPETTSALGGVTDVVATPDSAAVYATSGFADSAVVGFTRETAP